MGPGGVPEEWRAYGRPPVNSLAVQRFPIHEGWGGARVGCGRERGRISISTAEPWQSTILSYTLFFRSRDEPETHGVCPIIRNPFFAETVVPWYALHHVNVKKVEGFEVLSLAELDHLERGVRVGREGGHLHLPHVRENTGQHSKSKRLASCKSRVGGGEEDEVRRKEYA